MFYSVLLFQRTRFKIEARMLEDDYNESDVTLLALRIRNEQ